MKRLQILKLQYLVPEAAIQLFSCLTICKKFIVCLVTVVNRMILVWGVMAEHGIVGRRMFGSFIACFMPTIRPTTPLRQLHTGCREEINVNFLILLSMRKKKNSAFSPILNSFFKRNKSQAHCWHVFVRAVC